MGFVSAVATADETSKKTLNRKIIFSYLHLTDYSR